MRKMKTQLVEHCGPIPESPLARGGSSHLTPRPSHPIALHPLAPSPTNPPRLTPSHRRLLPAASSARSNAPTAPQPPPPSDNHPRPPSDSSHPCNPYIPATQHSPAFDSEHPACPPRPLHPRPPLKAKAAHRHRAAHDQNVVLLECPARAPRQGREASRRCAYCAPRRRMIVLMVSNMISRSSPSV